MHPPQVPDLLQDAAQQSQNVQRARSAPYNLYNPTVIFTEIYLKQTTKSLDF